MFAAPPNPLSLTVGCRNRAHVNNHHPWKQQHSVMLGTGMTLERADFTNILSCPSQRTSIPLGVLCQFILMPLSAAMIGRTLLLPYSDPLGKHLFLGLVRCVRCSMGKPCRNFGNARSLVLFFSYAICEPQVLVGCSPGGTASNLVSLIAGADV